MKKCLLVLLVIVMCLSVVSCSKQTEEQTETQKATQSTQSSEYKQETETPTEVPIKATEAPTEKPTEKKNEDTWKHLYKKRIDTYISGTNDKDNAIFSLVLIDDDSIPELVMGSTSHIEPAVLCWVYDNKLCEKQMGYMISGGFTYVECSGLIDICSQWQGSGGDTIYELMQGTLVEIANGTFNKMNHTYTWEGNSVPAMDYDYMLCEIFPRGNAKDVSDTTYSFEQILSVIDSYED